MSQGGPAESDPLASSQRLRDEGCEAFQSRTFHLLLAHGLTDGPTVVGSTSQLLISSAVLSEKCL